MASIERVGTPPRVQPKAVPPPFAPEGPMMPDEFRGEADPFQDLASWIYMLRMASRTYQPARPDLEGFPGRWQ